MALGIGWGNKRKYTVMTNNNTTKNNLLKELKINENAANGYCPLDQSFLVPLINMPSLSFSKLSNFLIVSQEIIN